MRIKSLALALLLLMSLICKAGQERDLIYSGGDASSIAKRLTKDWGAATTSEFDAFSRKFLAVVVDVGSGTTRKNIYLYVRSKDASAWNLILYRLTNSSVVHFEAEKDGISAYAKSDRRLIFLPAEGLNIDFDAAEQ